MSKAAELAAAFLQETFEDSPVLASQLGVDGYDDRLDDLSESAIDTRSRRVQHWLGEFESLSDSDHDSEQERVDKELILSVLRGRAILDDWVMWRRQPEIYLNPGLSGVFTLFLNRLKPEADLARAAIERLRGVPRLLEDGRRNIKPELAPAIYVDRAIRQARAGAS